MQILEKYIFYLVCCIEVFSHDGRLVLEDRELERVADNVQLLVTEVDSIVTRDVAQQVQGPRQSRVGYGGSIIVNITYNTYFTYFTGIVGKVWQSQYRLKFFSLYTIISTYFTYFTIDGIVSKVCSIIR